MRIHTTHTRDAALGELRRATRWIIAGSIGLTGVLAGVAANAFPGKTIKASAAKSGSGGTSSHGSSTTPAKPLAPPSQAPEASQSQPAQEPASPQQAPSQEAQPQPSQEAQQPQPSQEAPQPAPQASGEAAPAPESSGPVVSGGS
jgi:hypothetical protein